MDWEELAEELEEIGGTPDRLDRIAEYRRLLDEIPPGDEGRAEVLTCLGEDLRADGDPAGARAAYEEAVRDGGRTILEPRVGLLDVALEEGDAEGVDELLLLLLTMSRADQLVIGDYEWIAESLEESGRLREAMRWFTIPLRDIDPGDIERMPIIGLIGRWRVRRALELPPDAYDDAHDVWRELRDATR